MSKIDRTIGTRAESNSAPVTYELPRVAVAEAIVNAVAHRDYASNASMQVMLFSDRLEIWNPGHLPASLLPERLTKPHASIPRNPLLAGPLFLAGYAEHAAPASEIGSRSSRRGIVSRAAPRPRLTLPNSHAKFSSWRPRRSKSSGSCVRPLGSVSSACSAWPRNSREAGASPRACFVSPATKLAPHGRKA
jgi:ATP-dependent DNA helicase RecG